MNKARGLRYISIVGNSMGGLFARYAIGLLFDVDQGTICGLEPLCYVTTASPHLGLHGFVSNLVEDVLANLYHYGGAQLYGGRTGEQIFLADADCADFAPAAGRDLDSSGVHEPSASFQMPPSPKGSFPVLARDFPRLQTPRVPRPDSPLPPSQHQADGQEGPPSPLPTADSDKKGPEARPSLGAHGPVDRRVPLLLTMTTDRPMPFRAGLAAFRHRVAYGNTCNDGVRYATATIAAGDLPGWDARPPVSDAFPHIIHDSLVPHTRWPPPPRSLRDSLAAPSAASASPPRGGGGGAGRGAAGRDRVVGLMRGNLEGLGWRRVSARFARTVGVGARQAALPGLLGAVGVDAHNHLSVARPALNGPGRDTVAHVCRIILDHARAAAAADAAAAETEPDTAGAVAAGADSSDDGGADGGPGPPSPDARSLAARPAPPLAWCPGPLLLGPQAWGPGSRPLRRACSLPAAVGL